MLLCIITLFGCRIFALISEGFSFASAYPGIKKAYVFTGVA